MRVKLNLSNKNEKKSFLCDVIYGGKWLTFCWIFSFFVIIFLLTFNILLIFCRYVKRSKTSQGNQGYMWWSCLTSVSVIIFLNILNFLTYLLTLISIFLFSTFCKERSFSYFNSYCVNFLFCHIENFRDHFYFYTFSFLVSF